MNEDHIIGQLGLLLTQTRSNLFASADVGDTTLGLVLTQLRYARRALEDVERSTARYGGAGFAAALQAGPRFGAPPLLDGALKVYVVNIGDLAAGQGGSSFGTLLGGLGGLIGGIGGGFLGGFLGGAALPYNLAQLARIVEAVVKILGFLHDPKKPEERPKEEPPLDFAALTGLVRALTQLTPPLANLVRALGANLPDLVKPITDLYRLFVPEKKPDRPDTPLPSAPLLPPVDWMRFVEVLTPLVKALTPVVTILLGGFASLVVHLIDVQRAITDILTWALRILFLLRGAVLVVVYDTLAATASVGAKTLAVLATAVTEILSALFTALESALTLGMDLIAQLSKGISDTLNAIVAWVRTTLFDTLTQLGALPIFRSIVNIINATAGALSLLTGKSPVAPVTLPPAVGGASVSDPRKLDLAKTLADPSAFADIAYKFSETVSKTFSGIDGAIGKIRGALGEIERTNRGLEAGVGKPGDTAPLGKALGSVEARSNELGEALKKANVPEGARTAATGLEPIAAAFEKWLAGGALNTLLGQITGYFRAGPTNGPEAEKSIPGRIVVDVQKAGTLRPTVEIDEVVIEVEPPLDAPAAKDADKPRASRPPITLDQFAELMADFARDRNERFGPAHT
jgi:hypothetical protein